MKNEINLSGEEAEKQHCFFLFVNTGSGANLGSKLLEQEIESISFVFPAEEPEEKEKKCQAWIFNMRINKDEGFRKVKMMTENKNAQCYLIVCGGDGTVMWVVSELVKNEIDIKSVAIGIVALGTGNDFSRELGWGSEVSDLTENCFQRLKKLIRKWLKAKIEYFDIWDMEAEVFEHGKFEKVEGTSSVEIKDTKIKKTFCNYFSFGIDGKIGYSFDMHRTKSRLGNLAMYACMGIIKTMTRTKTLDELLDSIEIENEQEKSSNESFIVSNSEKSDMRPLDQTISMKKTSSISIRSTNFAKQIEGAEKEMIFAKDYYNILALNINSYTGGVKDIWEKAQEGFVKNGQNVDEKEVSTGDGKLEIVTFGSSFGIAMERTIGGFSKKVAQGSGPFTFNFHRYEKRPKHRTYLQIDGEFIRFSNPKTITISHSKMVPNGKIKVLRNSLIK